MTFMKGEVRKVGIEVMNIKNQDFIIDAAEYKIIDKEGNEIEKGYPTIDNHKILILFSAKERGIFYVVFKYHIGPEILKAKILIEVI